VGDDLGVEDRTPLADQAVGKHAAGDHDVEHSLIDAFAERVDGQLEKSIDAATGRRLIAFAQDLIATNG
jgi:hypothetical protein